MLFNSVEFALFLPIVFTLYWFVVGKSIKLQNGLLLAASYFFYGWWDWRFLGLIAFTSLVDYIVGINLAKEKRDKQRSWLLYTSIFVNLGLLGIFKYYNFFAENFAAAFSFFGQSFDVARLEVILPVGISFYTFQTLSYSIDVYREELEPTKDIVAFFAFVSFFPQLVAGPIERASNLLPQFNHKRKFEYHQAVDGIRQIIWGLFKKVVIADNCAIWVNEIFGNYQDYSGTTLLLGAIYFVFQVYGDFSGYSDIAVGTARLFGFNLMQNFATPYFATNMTDVWRRWHISLSTWFRDYVFTPLVFQWRNLEEKAIYLVTFITFFLIGIWHGGNWTFILFGVLNGLALSLDVATRHRRMNLKNSLKNLKLYYFSSWILTMTFWVLACILFRATDLSHAGNYIYSMITDFDFSPPNRFHRGLFYLNFVILMGVEWINRNEEHGLENLQKIIPNLFLRRVFYSGLLTIVMFFFITSGKEEFIYFDF